MTDTTHRPWVAHYPADVDWSGTIDQRPLITYLEDTAKRHGARLAIDFLGRKTTYQELNTLVARAAQGLKNLGVQKGTRVGLCLPNTPYAVIGYFAILRAGGTVVNFNPLYVERELAFQINDSGTEIMLTMDLELIYSKVGAMLKQTELNRIIVCPMAGILPGVKGFLFRLLKRKEIATIPTDDQHIGFDSLIDNDGNKPATPVEPIDTAVLQYTGGTTGTPKGAMLSHANLAANVSQMLHWFPDLRPGEEKILGVLPLFHVFAMTSVMNFAVAAGAEMILLPRYDRDQTLKAIHNKRPTLFPAVPTIYTSINEAPKLDKYDLSSISFCISGGAPLPLDVKTRFEKLTGCRLVEGYGLSECSPVATCNAINGINKAGSIGLPVPGTDISIHDIENPEQTVSVGERGELWIRGPQVMSGYWQQPEETDQTLRDGWLRTGDVGYMDEEGHLFLVDRIKDLILCSGYNVYPRTIEEAINLHSAVSEVTVIGIPDDYRGEAPKAFVRLQDGVTLTETELLDFLADKLSVIERPSMIEFRAELPKTMIGKLSKKELVEEETQRTQG